MFLRLPALGLAVAAMVALLSVGLVLLETSRIVTGSATMAPRAQAGNGAARSQPPFADSDYEHGRGPQGGRKKSWLSNIFD